MNSILFYRIRDGKLGIVEFSRLTVVGNFWFEITGSSELLDLARYLSTYLGFD